MIVDKISPKSKTKMRRLFSSIRNIFTKSTIGRPNTDCGITRDEKTGRMCTAFDIYRRGDFNKWLDVEYFQLKLIVDVNEHVARFINAVVTTQFINKWNLTELYTYFSNVCGFSYFINKTNLKVKLPDRTLVQQILHTTHSYVDDKYIPILLKTLDESWSCNLYVQRVMEGRIINVRDLLGSDNLNNLNQEQLLWRNTMIIVDSCLYLAYTKQFLWVNVDMQDKMIVMLEKFIDMVYYFIYNDGTEIAYNKGVTTMFDKQL